MVENLKLYINDKLVEFSTDPKVLYTYQATDVTNPTAVKNSFSKTITIDGTPNNNDIFGHYWNIERYLLNGGTGGAYFNSSKKAPFQLFIGSDLYEEGYAKLDNIQRNGSEIKYNITLYGGLGDFFYNLSTSDNGDKMKLSDLTFMDGGNEDEFNFTINIDTVNNAWESLRTGTTGMWQYINFMPAYNGKPSDFDADKVIINLSGTTLATSAINANDNKRYSAKQNFTVGTLPQEMTEWDVRDLRSYLQRPCIRMKEIVNACCNPENNGGYTVNLDTDFFNGNNPYWEKTWLSLPMIQNLEYSNDQQILTGVTLTADTTTGETSGLMYQDLFFELGDINPNLSNIKVKAKVTPYLRYPFCPYTSYVWFWNWNGDSYHTGNWCLGSLFVQLIAVNEDTVVGASEVYNLTTPIRHNGNLYYGHNGHYPASTGIDPDTGLRKMGNGSQYVPYMDQPIYSVLGKFTSNGFVKETSHTSSGSTYASNPYEFTFNIYNIGSPITGLKMVYYWGATADKIKKAQASNKLWDRTYDDAWMFRDSIYDYRQIDLTEHNITITSHNLNAVIGESLGRTGTQVTKQLLLNTESSPCDYLLSYCKMFGLHFTKDIGSKTINIMTRKTFYNRTDVVDLENYIDHSKDVNITPLLFSSKWYQFLQEKDETELQQKYLTAKGVEYGSKVLDTGYEFNAEKIDLLEDNCIKSGIEALEKSKWFIAYNNDDSLRPWMKVGLKYTLWNGNDEFEVNAGVGNSGDILPINEGQGMKYYDVIPKVQFHDSDGSPTDGNNCLVFYSGFKSVTSGRSNPLTYILSDDSVYQTDMNEGTPCWLFTKYETVNGKQICKKLNSIPVFERYLTNANSGVVTKSLDFGSAQELYVPNYSLTEDTNIYYNFWRTYLTDLFDINTKQMTCYVKIDTNPGLDWLRRFYWFNDAIWQINKISDWNPASYETTKVEFIKVQDLSNYTTITQNTAKTITLSADTYYVPYTGGTVTLSVGIESGAQWMLFRYGEITNPGTTAGTGTGSSTRTATFSASSEDHRRTDYFRAVRKDNGMSAVISIQQGYEGEENLSVVPSPIVVPASGKTIEFDFNWFNQGSNYVTGATTSGTFTVSSIDTATNREQNKASVVFGTNSTTGVTHGTVVFDGGVATATVYADQLPEGYEYEVSGGSVTVDFLYATGATLTNVPYWITVVHNLDGTVNLVAEENVFNGERGGTIRASINGTDADFTVYQPGNDGNKSLVYPDLLVFAATGGTSAITVDIQNGWAIVAKPLWVNTSSSSGSTAGTVTAGPIPYSGSEDRQGTIVFCDTVTSKNYQVTVIQTGVGEGEILAVSPGTLTFPASGGTLLLSIISNTNWTIA